MLKNFTTAFSISFELYKKLCDYCENSKRTRSSVIVEALEKYFNERGM